MIESEEQTTLHHKFKGAFKIIEVLNGYGYIVKAINSKHLYKYAHDR